MITRTLINFCTLLAIIFPLPMKVAAEQMAEFGDYKIHYTLINSLLIPESVARNHHITRSKNRMLMNISIRRDDSAVPAEVTGSFSNLLGQKNTLKFKEVREAEASYYLSSLLVGEKDTLRFSLNIRVKGQLVKGQPVEGQPKAFLLEFERSYYY